MGLRYFFNEKVPINDEGISLGQLAIGDSIIERERRNVHCNTRGNYKY